jgi:hypothetical protein
MMQHGTLANCHYTGCIFKTKNAIGTMFLHKMTYVCLPLEENYHLDLRVRPPSYWCTYVCVCLCYWYSLLGSSRAHELLVA